MGAYENHLKEMENMKRKIKETKSPAMKRRYELKLKSLEAERREYVRWHELLGANKIL